MNLQPDKIFRDNLEGFSKPVPSRAWDKIETNLNKKNHSGLWLKVAASLLLLAAGTYILWPADETVHVNQYLSNKTIDEPVKTDKSESKTSSKTHETQSDLESIENKKVEKNPIKQTQPSPQVVHTLNSTDRTFMVVTENITTIKEEPVENTIEQTAEIVAESETSVAQQTIISEPAVQNITLVFNADDTDEYLDKKSLAKATAEQENTSTFKKLLKKVKGLKNNQDPFGELRQKKNEILALNFKNEKRGQNK